MRRSKSQRPAVMYVAVLITATIVSVIGLCALAAARVQFRSAENGNEVVMARLAAQSAVELARYQIENDLSWRTTYTHNTWTSDYSLGRATMSFKLVDEANESLTADDSAPVWVYGRGQVGDAVRTYRVLVEISGTVRDNVLVNGGFESGTSNWTADSCELLGSTDAPHNGAMCLLVRNRTDSDGGPAQSVLDRMEDHSSYEIEIYVKMASHSDVIWIGFNVKSLLGWMTFEAEQQTVGTTWTKITATVPMFGSLLIKEMVFSVCTASGTQDFMIDNAVVYVAGTGAGGISTTPVSGTWERVVDSTVVVERGAASLPEAAAGAAIKLK